MLSLFAYQEREPKLDSHNDPLALLNKHVDFATMAAEIDRWVSRPSRAKDGWPPYPTELMTRLLVPHHLFHLSDGQMTVLVARPPELPALCRTGELGPCPGSQ